MRGLEQRPLGGGHVFELQIHGPRGRVRYLAVTGLKLDLVFAAGLLFCAFFVNAVVATPTVAAAALARGDQVERETTRQRLGERFRALEGRYDAVRQLALDLDHRLCKVVLAYGVEEAAGACGDAAPLVGPSDASDSEAGFRAVRAAVADDLVQVTARLEGRLQAAFDYEAASPEQVGLTPSLAPLGGDDFVLVAPFGETTNRVTSAPEFHYGIDLAAPAGSPVRAPAAGRVTFAGQGAALGPAWRRYGRLLSVRHGDRFITVFAHLEDTQVRVGATVRKGQRIGTVGSSGWSVEPNLHYGILRRREDDSYEPVDPRIHILDYRWENEHALVSGFGPAPAGFPPLPRTLLR